jgi:hypothetical protein
VPDLWSFGGLYQQAFIDKLKIGQAIIKLKGRFTQPILVQFPHSKIENSQEVTP